MDFSNFTGTSTYHRAAPNLLLTDGALYLAEQAKCFWLMDVIASYLPTIPSDEHFCIAVLKVQYHKAHFELVDDIPTRRYYATQEIEYTDFPLNEIKLYVARGGDFVWAAMLPQEY